MSLFGTSSNFEEGKGMREVREVPEVVSEIVQCPYISFVDESNIFFL